MKSKNVRDLTAECAALRTCIAELSADRIILLEGPSGEVYYLDEEDKLRLRDCGARADCPACLGSGTIAGGHDCSCQYEDESE